MQTRYQTGDKLLVRGETLEVKPTDRESGELRAQGQDGTWHTLPVAPADGGRRAYIDVRAIESMVHRFYERVQIDPVLSPIFASKITDWPPHLARMVHFWSAILLAAPGFHGNPMQKHREIQGANREDFDRWLALFADTLGDIFDAEHAEWILIRARRIAGRLSAAMFDEASPAPTR